MTVAVQTEFLIQWHLTERCNLACSHCYQDGKVRPELSLDQVFAILKELEATFEAWNETYGLVLRPRLQLTGGEPLLWHNIFDLIDLAKGMGFAISMLTNGTLVSEEIADEIAEREVDLVQVSMEGTKPVHDRIRGEGAYDAAASGIRRLSRRGQFVSVNATLSKMNCEDVDDLIDEMKTLGADRVAFARLVPSGGGASLATEMLSAAELKKVYEKIKARDDLAIEIACRDPLMALLDSRVIPSAGDIAIGGCTAGVAGITILPDGTAMACRRLGIELGNLLETPFRELWADSPELWCLRSRENYSGRCGECDRWASCRGCRAVAYAGSLIAGQPDLCADDPQCWTQPAA